MVRCFCQGIGMHGLVKLINDGNDVDEVNESCLEHIVETKSQEESKRNDCDMKKFINIERCSSLKKFTEDHVFCIKV